MTHVSVSYVNKSLKKSFAKYGIEANQVSSHMFRKSFAYKVLEDDDFSDKAIFLVSRLLNHSNINITMKYLLLHEKEELEIYKSLTL
jgi:integrase